MSIARKYRIICLKRSEFEALGHDTFTSDWYASAYLVYWMPNRAGYTDSKTLAGRYTAEELSQCAGSHGDWLVEPCWDGE
jgi:hypothetical protein